VDLWLHRFASSRFDPLDTSVQARMFSRFPGRILMQHHCEELPMNHVIAILLSIAITVASACGTGASASTEDPAVPASRTASTLPDLNDPEVRHQFVCSFGPGSFRTPPTTLGIDPSCPNNAIAQP
jgi:hypothetical protein